MINTVYRLVAPRRFEIAFEDINLFGENAIVRPTYLSICNADMRYYLGKGACRKASYGAYSRRCRRSFS